MILFLFLVKILAGIFIGWMSQKFYPQGNDYWDINTAGWSEYQLLLSDPKKFFSEIFVSNYPNGYGGFFNPVGSYWNDLKNTLIGKLLGCMNLLTRGNYYLNSLFCNFFGFFGYVALYRVFSDIYQQKKWPVIIGTFLLPSTLYFSSGIHKDLVVFTALCVYSYSLYFSIKKRSYAKYLPAIILTFVLILLFRNFLAIALIPASIALVASLKIKWYAIGTYLFVYVVSLITVLCLPLISPVIQPLKIITERQKDFSDLPPTSSPLTIPQLEPRFISLVKNAATAIDHSLFHPYLWKTQTKFLMPLAIEIFLYECCFILMIFQFRGFKDMNPFVLFGLFTAFTMFLFIGYIVPNTGSIVRYRSLYLPFILTPLLNGIHWVKKK
jgi:uncharacterized protein with PQ loop repeat